MVVLDWRVNLHSEYMQIQLKIHNNSAAWVPPNCHVILVAHVPVYTVWLIAYSMFVVLFMFTSWHDLGFVYSLLSCVEYNGCCHLIAHISLRSHDRLRQLPATFILHAI